MHTKGLGRQFHSGSVIVNALNDVNIAIRPEKLTLLRGRSGSGKTTLLNLLGILDRPSGGGVFMGDLEVSALSDHRRDEIRRLQMGFIFQSVALISFMTALENIEFGLRIAGVPAGERNHRAMEVLSLVGLSRRYNHRSQELSGGEQQRVAIARALAHNPRIIFADEPTAELDSHMGLQIMKLFRKLVDEQGVTIVMTSHDPNIMSLADHIYGLDDGMIVQDEENHFEQ